MKRNLIISVIIIAVLGAYLIFSKRGGSDVPELPDWEGSADEIVIKRPSATIKLVRKEGKWLINEQAYPAAKSSVEGIEKTLRELAIADLVSEKGMFANYDLTPEKAMEVIVRQGNEEVRHILFGKKSTASQHTFIRLGADTGVYMASGTFDTLADASVESLRDKDIVKISRSDVSFMAITYKGNTFSFALEKQPAKENKDKKNKKDAKTELRWVSKGPAEPVFLDAQRMNSLLKVFDPLTAQGFAEVARETLKNPIASAVLKTSKKEVTLQLFKEKDEYYAVSSESPYVFTVSEWTAKKFMVEKIDALKSQE